MTVPHLIGLLTALGAIIGPVLVWAGKTWGTYSERSGRDDRIYQRMEALVDREQRESDEAKTALKDLQESMAQLVTDHAQVVKELAETKVELAALRGEFEKLTLEFHGAISQLAEKDEEINQLETAVESLEARLAKAILERDQYEQLWRDSRKESSDGN